MKIEIYGPGCPKCHQSFDLINKALKELHLQAEVELISKLDRIIDKGIMLTPAVFIDGKKFIEGKVPKEADIKDWLIKEVK